MSTVTVSPATNDLTVAERGTHAENVRATIPQQGAIAKIDVYFLTDSTASMVPIIDAVKNGASQILGQLRDIASGVGANLHFGVGDYKDFDHSYWFKSQQSLTAHTPDVETAIRNWTTTGGRTTAEGQLYALDQLAQPPGGTIGWRPDAKRILVWFGDAPGHDPICQAISGLPYNITEQSATTKLQEQGIIVLAISTPTTGENRGLDVDPVPRSSGGDYQVRCGIINGRDGQGSRIAAATGGTYADNINANTIVETIIRLGGAEVSRIGNVRLVANKRIAPFVAAIAPQDGHGPLEGNRAHELSFDVSFAGVSPAGGSPPRTRPVIVNGALEVRVDGVVAGRKSVRVTVPDLTGRYKIVCMKSQKLLQVANPSWTGDGGNVSQGSDTDEAHQQWELIPVDGGGYHIKNLATNKTRYLEVKGQSTENMAEILTRENPSGRHKQWGLIPMGSDDDGVIYRIQNLNSGKVLDVRGGSTNEGVLIYQHGYWGDYPTWQKEHHHHWRLVRL
jgi:hypothetical protein